MVLDGVARAPEIKASRQLANEEEARFLLVMTECADIQVHRARVVGRTRQIPNWYELDWAHVERARNAWVPIDDVDLTLEATDSLERNEASLRRLIDSRL